METIENLLEKFRQRTLDMIECFKNEDYAKLNLLLEERQKILDILKDNEEYYKTKDIIKQLETKDIVKLDESINNILIESIDSVRRKLKELDNNSKQQKYHRGFSGNAMFLNKKI
jgi:molybdopterin-guanine dinucleotide biosynthesis protein